MKARAAALAAAAARLRQAPQPGPRRARRPLDGYWWGGYAAAMSEVIEVADETLARAGDSPDALRLALRAVVLQAAAAIELQASDSFPDAWLDGRP